MFCFSILWGLPEPKCLVLLYFGGFRCRNALFYNIVGVYGAEMFGFTILWAVPGPKWFVFNIVGASGAEMLSFIILWGLPGPKCFVL